MLRLSLTKSTTPEPVSPSQPSIFGSEAATLGWIVFNPNDTSDEEGEEVYLSDAPSTQKLSGIMGNLGSNAEVVAKHALGTFFSIISSPSWNVERNGDEWFAEITGNRLRSSCFEVQVDIDWKHGEAGQKPAMADDNGRNGAAPVYSRTLPARHLACPFYLRQKERYLSCLTCFDIREIKDLKRHLSTAHRQPTYCPICYSIFERTQDWEYHVRLGSCTSSGNTRPEGITILQMQQLAQQEDPRVSRKLQWLLIFDVVFPGVRPPSLAFDFDEVEPLIWMFRDFWSAEGDGFVSAFLAERRQRGLPLDFDEADIATLSPLVLESGINQLLARCTRGKSNEWPKGGPPEEVSHWRLPDTTMGPLNLTSAVTTAVAFTMQRLDAAYCFVSGLAEPPFTSDRSKVSLKETQKALGAVEEILIAGSESPAATETVLQTIELRGTLELVRRLCDQFIGLRSGLKKLPTAGNFGRQNRLKINFEEEKLEVFNEALGDCQRTVALVLESINLILNKRTESEFAQLAGHYGAQEQALISLDTNLRQRLTPPALDGRAASNRNERTHRTNVLRKACRAALSAIQADRTGKEPNTDDRPRGMR
ncbi:hypothetical protein F5Y14DRAFT_219281 [Nemania sp. NC0429]|nr:hypothetical protein F5Y14DRAFT_219281 [Nemania sp. NC0429]